MFRDKTCEGVFRFDKSPFYKIRFAVKHESCLYYLLYHFIHLFVALYTALTVLRFS